MARWRLRQAKGMLRLQNTPEDRPEPGRGGFAPASPLSSADHTASSPLPPSRGQDAGPGTARVVVGPEEVLRVPHAESTEAGGTASDGSKDVTGIKEVVSPEEVTGFSHAKPASVSVPLTATQQAGMTLAKLVGFAIFAVMLVVLGDFLVSRPKIPQFVIPLAGTPAADIEEQNDQIVEDYRAVNDVAVGRALSVFETVVATSLLPVFTAILGYIFGRTERVTGSSEGS